MDLQRHVIPDRKMHAIRDWLHILLGLVVASVFIYLTFRRLEWISFRNALALASFGPIGIGAGLLAADFSLRIVRWWWLLRAFEPSLTVRTCAGPLLASFAVNNLLPLHAGDLLRAVGFCHQLQSPPMRVLGTVFIERLLDLCVILGFLFVGLLTLPNGVLPQSFIKGTILLALVCLFLFLLVLMTPESARRGFRWVASRPALRNRRPITFVDKLMDQFISTVVLLRSPSFIVQLITISIIVWILEGAIYAAVASSLGIDAGVFGPWFSLATGTLATLLPSTPGYLGTFDYFATLGLMAYGAQKDVAVVFSLIVHVLLWFPITLIGGLYLATPKGRTFRKSLRAYQSV